MLEKPGMTSLWTISCHGANALSELVLRQTSRTAGEPNVVTVAPIFQFLSFWGR